MDMLRAVFLGMVILWPAFVLPLIAGIAILIYFRGDPIRGLAGAFTMKPVLATPVWLYIILTITEVGNRGSPPTLIPGIGLTLLLLYLFRRLFRTERKAFLLLLAGDAVRWLYSLAYLRFWMGSLGDLTLKDPPFLVGILLPNAYALMAFLFLWIRRTAGRPEQVSAAGGAGG